LPGPDKVLFDKHPTLYFISVGLKYGPARSLLLDAAVEADLVTGELTAAKLQTVLCNAAAQLHGKSMTAWAKQWVQKQRESIGETQKVPEKSKQLEENDAIQQMRAELEALRTSEQALRADVARQQAEVEAFRSELDRSRQAEAAVRAELEAAKDELATAQAELERERKDHAARLAEAEKAAESARQAAEALRAELEAERRAWEDAAAATAAEIGSLRQRVGSLERDQGGPDAAR
jgi:chromosome segregation ATPase